MKTSKMEAGPAKTDGKAIDEWVFKTSRPTERSVNQAVEIKVKVNLVNTKEGLAFRAKLPELDDIEDSDIQRLRERVESTLMEHSAVALGAVWEDWLCVSVRNDAWRQKETLSSALSIDVKPVKRGIDPQTGVAYIMTPERNLIPVRMEKLQEKPPRTADDELMLREQVEISFVPATPENIAALEDARDRVIRLRERLARAFSQEEIHSTLQKIGTALPALGSSVGDEIESSKSKAPRP